MFSHKSLNSTQPRSTIKRWIVMPIFLLTVVLGLSAATSPTLATEAVVTEEATEHQRAGQAQMAEPLYQEPSAAQERGIVQATGEATEEEEPSEMRHQPDPSQVESVDDLWSKNASSVPTISSADNPMSVEAVLSPTEDSVVELSDGDVYIFHESGTFDADVTFRFTAKMEIEPPTRPITYNHMMQSFELSMVDSVSAEEIHTFDHPIRVILDMRKYGIDLGEEGGEFFFAYQNPLNHAEYIDVPITVYKEEGLYTADVTHFSGEWATGWRPEGWTLHWDLPSSSGFNGAATYNYPIEVPPGHNGMQPNINLGYSSSAMNGAMRTLNGGTVAAGWSLSDISIVRTGVELISQCTSNRNETYRMV